MNENIIIKPSVKSLFDRFMQHGRVFFVSAPCGFGKTATVNGLLSGHKALRMSADDSDFELPGTDSDFDILLIDDLQNMQEESELSALCELIRGDTKRRFILLSRGTPPGELIAFQYTGLMNVLRADDLLFGRDEVRSLLYEYGIDASESDIGAIQRETIGQPLAVSVVAQLMCSGKCYSTELAAEARREVFLYFESNVYHRFDLLMRRFLLELAPFESFDIEMARMVSGDSRAGEKLDRLLRITTMLCTDGSQHLRFRTQFRDFLLWELEREYTDEKRRALFIRGGLYYELKEDYAHALECYSIGGDRSKVSELLIRNAELHPGMGHYSEMERYYRSLPESEILLSPSLMQGMSMLCALTVDYAESERWYGELKKFAERCDKHDAAGKQARSRLAWLDISLPQRGVSGLCETIPAVFRLLCEKEVALPAFSVTSALPSIMNGGKDFSEWSKKDDFLYTTMRIPVEAVLGKDGVGLADCAIAESKFEKGEDISARMLSIIPHINEVRNGGTPDTEFAINGLLARSQLASGRSMDARHTISSLRERFAERNLTRFLPNMDAMLCRIDLYSGDLDSADSWYREKAPREPTNLNVMKRYRYFTQAMVELARGMTDEALLTLSPLEPYIKNCDRHIDGIHMNMLRAIALFRKGEKLWRVRFSDALDAAAEYHFIRTISIYGAAVLPLLENMEIEYGTNRKWYKQLLNEVRAQAAFYPDFLLPRLTSAEELTPAELRILRLICADRSNSEIAQILDIKLPTVKTHVSHILDKLNVRRRVEAKTAAVKLHLISEE